MRSRSGYYVRLNDKDYFIVQSTYYVKDMVLKNILMKNNYPYDYSAIRSLRSKLKRATIGVDNLDNQYVKLYGGSITYVNNCIIIDVDKFKR